MNDPTNFLNELFKAGLAAADPMKVIPAHLPEKPKGRAVVIGAGKASASMARAVELAWADTELSGAVVTRYDYGVNTEHIEIVEAAHPVPDEAGQKACARILELVQNLSDEDLVLALISGGGSSLLSMPAPCLSAEQKRKINKELLKSGASIHEMNCVRKHLSAVKGGRLALAAHPARVCTLVISDVPGDDPSTIASGPTLSDASTLEQALEILEKYKISITDEIRAWLQSPENETPKPGDARISDEVIMAAKAQDMLSAAAHYAASKGVEPIILGDDLEGDARILGDEHVQKAFQHLSKGPLVLLSGGETTVKVSGNGKGGRNTEYLLASTIAALGNKQIYGIACDSDGIDGSEDNAGAFFTPDSLARAKKLDLKPDEYLENNDSYSFFKALDQLIITGPTYTNVNDFRAILVL